MRRRPSLLDACLDLRCSARKTCALPFFRDCHGARAVVAPSPVSFAIAICVCLWRVVGHLGNLDGIEKNQSSEPWKKERPWKFGMD